jgi:hypothetical protein
VAKHRPVNTEALAVVATIGIIAVAGFWTMILQFSDPPTIGGEKRQLASSYAWVLGCGFLVGLLQPKGWRWLVAGFVPWGTWINLITGDLVNIPSSIGSALLGGFLGSTVRSYLFPLLTRLR